MEIQYVENKLPGQDIIILEIFTCGIPRECENNRCEQDEQPHVVVVGGGGFFLYFFVFNRYSLPPQRLKINFSKAKVCSGYLSGLGAELTSMAGGVASIVLLVIQSG